MKNRLYAGGKGLYRLARRERDERSHLWDTTCGSYSNKQFGNPPPCPGGGSGGPSRIKQAAGTPFGAQGPPGKKTPPRYMKYENRGTRKEATEEGS